MSEKNLPKFSTAVGEGYWSCHICHKLGTAGEHHCQRCGKALHARKTDSVQRTIAYAFAAVIAYIPANLLPIMFVTELGRTEGSTILAGVATFWGMHAYPVAIIIFIASVLIPGLKLLALATLCLAASGRIRLQGRRTNQIYWLTELVGRWSMVDVFVVAILVGLVQFDSLMTIKPGPAVVSFGLMVILTMIAAHAFDPKLVWDQLRAQGSPLEDGKENEEN